MGGTASGLSPGAAAAAAAPLSHRPVSRARTPGAGAAKPSADAKVEVLGGRHATHTHAAFILNSFAQEKMTCMKKSSNLMHHELSATSRNI
jgi:hypothetical protein